MTFSHHSRLFNLPLLFLIINLLARATCKLPCLNPVDPIVYPTCEIIDNARPGPSGVPSPSYECLKGWGNSIFLSKDGSVTLDCWASFPIDIDYDGVRPIKNLNIEFYKRINESGIQDEIENPPMQYGVRVHIIAKVLEYSGNYIFHSLGNPEQKVIIYVFAEKRDLPLFLDLKGGKHLIDATVDTTENAIVIPCRSANYNATVLGLYFQYEDLKEKIDGVNLRYDPRRGYIRKIPPEDSEDEIYGTYECYTEWKSSGRDRIKIIAKAPPSPPMSGEEEEEVTTTSTEQPKITPLIVLPGIITFHPMEEKKFKSKCTLPQELVEFNTPFFANAFMKNPTASRFNVKCSHLDSNCGENVRILGNVTSPNVLEIQPVHPSGLTQCVVSSNMEILEYFTGADGHIYFDWNDALAKQAIVKIVPKENYPRYIDNHVYGFNCIHPTYITVNPIRWGITYENGTTFEAFDSEQSKMFTLHLDMVEIECSVTLWNSTTWYQSTLEIKVTDYILPVIRDQNRRMSFKTDEINQALRCEVEPGPVTTIEWYRDDKKIDDIPMINLKDSSVLFFIRINATYEGNYTCRASTKSGSTEAEFQIVLDEDTKIEDDAGRETEDKGPSNCTGRMGEVILYHMSNHQEVESLDSIAEDETFLLKFSKENCSITEEEEPSGFGFGQILIRVLKTKDVDFNTTFEILEDYPPARELEIVSSTPSPPTTEDEDTLNTTQIVEDLPSYDLESSNSTTPEDLLEENVTTAGSTSGGSTSNLDRSDDGTNRKRTKARGMYHYLFPWVIGLTIVLVVLIIAYGTYSYFVSPWKVRRISTVSRGPIY